MKDSSLPYSNCTNCESLRKSKKKLQRKVKDLEAKITKLQNRMEKNQEE